MFKKWLAGMIVLSLCLILPVEGKAQDKTIPVIIKTTEGDMVVELYKDKAPVTVQNFLSYVDEKFYDNTIFHRVIKNFMIQGGGLTPDLKEKSAKSPIKNEADNGLSNEKYTIAMARTSAPHSATCQFYINHVHNSFLDHKNKSDQGYGYCVFGKVVKGMDVVEKIATVKTVVRRESGLTNLPEKTVKIISIRRK